LKQQHVDDQQAQYHEFTTLIRGIGHEMNTPLGVGITAASVLEKKLAELSTSISNNSLTKQCLLNSVAVMQDTVALVSDNMTEAANKLSNLQDITVNDTEVHAGNYQIGRLVDEAFTLYEHDFELNNVNYTVVSEANIDQDIFIKAQMFHKVLLILFKNSIEHGFKKQQQDTITIAIKEGVDCFVINYHDNGVGLNQDCLDIIFTPYYTSNVMSDSSGLGLAIAKRIMTQQLGGNISAMTCSDGAYFSLRLPKI
jgi:signal transduction histidine kinase